MADVGWMNKLKGFLGFINGTQVAGSGRVLKLNYVGEGITGDYNTETGVLTFDLGGLAPTGGTALVAKVSGTNTDNEGEGATPTLYTVPAGRAGLYRFTSFVGPATTGGSGQVSIKWHWPTFGAGTGNLAFMQPGESGAGGGTTFVTGEGSSVTVDPPMTWWAEEGGVIRYELQPSYSGGDWIWGVSLEYLGPN